MSTATITWRISGKELISFLHAKNNKPYKSNSFYLNVSNSSAKFMLECYSNGMNKGEEGSVDLFLKIISLPEHASDITLRYSLQCVETNTSFTKIKTFNRETTNSCWPYNTLQLNELLKLSILTFQCDLQILSLKYKKSKSVIGTVTNHYCDINVKMNKYTSFTWDIFNIEYDNFMNCKCRKQINSALFGKNRFFQLECYPNGTKMEQRGNVVMGLSLLLLPPLISSIKLFYSFECIQCNKEWSNVHNFSYNQSVKGWPIGLIKQDQLYAQTKKDKHITFKCHIEILKLYDHTKQEIHQKYWQRFMCDNTHSKQNNKMSNSSVISYENNDSAVNAAKDIEINKLTQSVCNLQHTVEVMRRELQSLHSGGYQSSVVYAQSERPMLQNSHSDRRYHHGSYQFSMPTPLPPLHMNEPPQYSTYTHTHYKPPKHKHNHYSSNPKNREQKKRHPRSRSDVQQLRQGYTNKGFYPYDKSYSQNLEHSNAHLHTNKKRSKNAKRKQHGSVNGIYGHKMSALNSERESAKYKQWYQSPYKGGKSKAKVKRERKKTDEGFANNIRAFVQINDIVNDDMVQQMETNTNNNNPFFNQEQSSIKINDSDSDSRSFEEENKSNEGSENNMNAMVVSQSMGTPHRAMKDSVFKKHSKYKGSEYMNKRVRHKKKQRFHRSQSEKKIYENGNGKMHMGQPRFVNEYSGGHEQFSGFENGNGNGNNPNYDRQKLKQWLCNDLGFSLKYFNLFCQNGYDNIDIVVELEDSDLIEIGIHNQKYRHKLLTEFAKFNPFLNETLGGGGHYI